MASRNVKHKSAAALILVDVINHFEFPDGARLLKNAFLIAPRLARLKERARRAGIPAIYVNDNFGQWRSNASKLLEYCLRPEAPGRDFVAQVQPDDEDYLVLKPMHSAFYQSPLDVLLRHLGAATVILGGWRPTLASSAPLMTPICGSWGSLCLPTAARPAAAGNINRRLNTLRQ